MARGELIYEHRCEIELPAPSCASMCCVHLSRYFFRRGGAIRIGAVRACFRLHIDALQCYRVLEKIVPKRQYCFFFFFLY